MLVEPGKMMQWCKNFALHHLGWYCERVACNILVALLSVTSVFLVFVHYIKSVMSGSLEICRINWSELDRVTIFTTVLCRIDISFVLALMHGFSGISVLFSIFYLSWFVGFCSVKKFSLRNLKTTMSKIHVSRTERAPYHSIPTFSCQWFRP